MFAIEFQCTGAHLCLKLKKTEHNSLNILPDVLLFPVLGMSYIKFKFAFIPTVVFQLTSTVYTRRSDLSVLVKLDNKQSMMQMRC